MQKISQDSLRELNAQVDAEQLLRDLGSQRVDARGDNVVADCPLEPGVKAVLTVEVGSNFATCSSSSCAAHQRRSMLWIFCRGRGVGLQEGAQQLAAQTGVLLEFEGEDPGGEEPQVIELVSAPAEIGPVDSPSLRVEQKAAESVEVKFCPLVRADCVQDRCQWWVVDWLEEKHTYRRNCAISLIAIGLTDESLSSKKK